MLNALRIARFFVSPLDFKMTSDNRKDRETAVAELTDMLSGASSAVVVNYTGMSVAAQQELKNRLREVGATMKVAKNTLIKIASANAKLPGEFSQEEVLVGQTALILGSDDAIAPLQILAKFADEFQVPSMKVGIVDGAFQDGAALTVLAKLPSKEVLAGQVVGALMAPSYGLVGVLNANMTKLVFILSEKVKQGGA